MGDCVKALKHLFNRYGYVSPAFEAVEHQHGYGQPHSHVAGEVDAQKLVHTLGPNGDDDHTKPNKGYEAAKPTGDLEERSSCTGSSCENPLEVDHDHKEIQLDSLEDLAHVIDDEIIHRTADHEHVPSKPQKVREYEPFIVQEEAPGTAVDIPAVTAPTKEELAKKVLESRETTTYEEIALPSFAPVSYKAAEEEEKPHYVRADLLKGRETKTSYGTSTGGEGWWAKPAAPAKTSQNWWEVWTADMPDDASSNPQ